MRSRKLMHRCVMVFVASAFAGFGCDGEGGQETKSAAGPSAGKPTPSSPQRPAGDEVSKAGSAAAGRKIIYNAHVSLVTEDLNPLEAALSRLIAEQGAYVADSERTGSAGSTRLGTWKVRVPVERYDPFVKGVVALGELVSLKADSQDVSEEYVDLDSRRAAKQVEEARLLKHLADSTGKLDEILAVERELSRVRTEVERMQGRLRALADLTTLATVTIAVSEIKGYVPPQAPTLGTRLGRTFAASLASLRSFGEETLILIAAALPWLPLVGVGLGVALWMRRRATHRGRRVASPAEMVFDDPAQRGG